MDIEKLKEEIIQRLAPLDPEKVILFGSYAEGSPGDESDIDLYVVTKDDFIPRTFKEKMEIKLSVSGKIKDLKKMYDFDLIVHTKKMNEKFIQNGSLFSKTITEKGKVLYG